jgi:hypothetical protein
MSKHVAYTAYGGGNTTTPRQATSEHIPKKIQITDHIVDGGSRGPVT